MMSVRYSSTSTEAITAVTFHSIILPSFANAHKSRSAFVCKTLTTGYNHWQSNLKFFTMITARFKFVGDIKLKSPTGDGERGVDMTVRPTASWQTIVDKIREVTGIPVHRQRIIYRGKDVTLKVSSRIRFDSAWTH